MSDALHKSRECASGCSTGQNVTPECEVVMEGEEDDLEARFNNCRKHPNHPNFFPCSKFKVEDLPQGYRTMRMMDEIFRRCVQTVRIKVVYVSENRPEQFADSNNPYPYAAFKGSDRVVRYGTGKVIQVFFSQGVEGKLCPCPLCKNSTRPKKFWWIRVRTATHVIYDRSEAERASFECFFDDGDDVKNNKVRTIYGFDTFNIADTSDKTFRSDVCDVLCVTHEEDVASSLDVNLLLDGDFLHQHQVSDAYAPSKVIVSHPHGRFKRITVGTVLHLTTPISQHYPINSPLQFKDGTVYRASTRAEVHASSYCMSCDVQKQENCPECTAFEAEMVEQYTKEMGSADDIAVNINNDMKPKEAFITSQQYNMKEKLQAFKSQLRGTGIACRPDIAEDDEDNNWPFYERNGMTKEDYLANFYCIFTREQLLQLILISAVLRQKLKTPHDSVSKQTMNEAFQDIYNMLEPNRDGTSSDTDEHDAPGLPNFKNRTENTHQEVNNQSSRGTHDNVAKPMTPPESASYGNRDGLDEHTSNVEYDEEAATYWLANWQHLLTLWERRFVKFKSESLSAASVNVVDKDKSLLLSLFTEIDKIVDCTRVRANQNQVSFNESALPLIFESVLKSTFKTLIDTSKKENRREIDDNKPQKNNEKTSQNVKDTDRVTSGNVCDIQKGPDAPGTLETKRNMPSSEREVECTRSTNDSELHCRNSDNAQEINVPTGSTFTLPPNAEYAFRVYSDSPAWISFPPGTKMTHPDGDRETTIEIGEPRFEFKLDFFVPEQSYVTYDIATCPGSSGATVFCDHALGRNVSPLFPHSGHLEENGLNRSGIRHNVYSLYSKLILANSGGEITKCLMKGGNRSGPQQFPSLLEVIVALTMKLTSVFMKSMGK